MNNSRLVYSTDQGRVCSDCGQAQSACRCQQAEAILGDGQVRVHRDNKGRGGKRVLLVKGLPLTESDMKLLATELKKKLGCGGTYKDGSIEIQSEKPEVLVKLLQDKGFKAKLAGN